MRHILRGLDRGVLDNLGYTKGAAWPLTLSEMRLTVPDYY